MSSELKLRRGSTAAHSTFTGADGEVTFDTDKNVVVSHDGATVGGFPHTKAADLAASGGSALVSYLPAGTGAVATTVENKLRESVSVLDFGVNTVPGTTDMTSAFVAASATGKLVYVPGGIYKVSGRLNSGTNCQFYGDGITESFITCAGTTYAGYLFQPESAFNISGLHIVGNSLPGMYAIGDDTARQHGRSKLRDLIIYDTYTGVYFHNGAELSAIVQIDSVVVNRYFDAGIDIGGTGATTANSALISFGGGVSAGNPGSINTRTYASSYVVDGAYDNISWSMPAILPRFGYCVMRSLDNATDWHVPPNMSGPISSAVTTFAAANEGQTWYYSVVAMTVGVHLRNVFSVDSLQITPSYVGIGIYLNDCRCISFGPVYFEARQPNPATPMGLFAAVYARATTGITIGPMYVDNVGYAVYLAYNSTAEVDHIYAIDVHQAMIGQSGATAQYCMVKKTTADDDTSTTAFLKSPGWYYGTGYTRIQRSDAVLRQTLDHPTNPEYAISFRHVKKLSFGYSTAAYSYLTGLNSLDVTTFSKSKMAPPLRASASLFTNLTHATPSVFLTYTMINGTAVSLVYAFTLYVRSAGNLAQTSTGILTISTLVNSSTPYLTVTLSGEAQSLAAGTLTAVFTMSAAGLVASVACNATSSVGTPTYQIMLTPITSSSRTLPTDITQA